MTETKTATALLGDPKAPLDMKKQIVGAMCANADEETDRVLSQLFAAAGKGASAARVSKKEQALDAKLSELERGPLRQGTFYGVLEQSSAGRRAHVLLPDGSEAYCFLPNDELAARLAPGETLWIDGQGRAALFSSPAPAVGEEAKLERWIDAERLEVSSEGRGRGVVFAAQSLRDQYAAGEAPAGAQVLVCHGRKMAFRALPGEDGPGHYRFLSQEPVPDVHFERDIAAPPAVFGDLLRHLEAELREPESGAAYRLPRATMTLLTGPPGTGKSLCLAGFWRRMIEVTAEVYGVEPEDLPSRAMRLRPASVLSPWLGESDQNLDRFFDEVEHLATTPQTLPDGRSVKLPLIVILEEIDGLARARGHDGIHDRILVTLLERLDVTGGRLADELIFFVSTTNLASAVDPAFLRRAGARVARFGRLDRAGFAAVLEKLLGERPLQPSVETSDPAAAVRALVGEVTPWLYGSPNADPAVLEVRVAGETTPLTYRRREVVTPALVERAVRACATAARDEEVFADAERRNAGGFGLRAEPLIEALADQIAAQLEQIDVHSAAIHLPLPDGARVTGVRRLTPTD